MEQAMNLRQSGSFLGLSPYTVRLKARRGEIAHYRLGRRVVFDKRDPLDFLARHRVGGSAEEHPRQREAVAV